ncbi:hypothetical protein SZ00_01637 [Rhodococcus sp. AD45]|nr:hypothetical protein SZ00_01637 [Rhodococcus sp. AD45]
MVRECDAWNTASAAGRGGKNVGAPIFWHGLEFRAPWAYPEQHDSFGRSLTRNHL